MDTRRVARIAALAAWTTAAAVGAVWLAERHLPAGPAVHAIDFRLGAKTMVELDATAGRPVELPYPFGDFDLDAELRLAAGTEVDVVVRRVEPMQRGAPSALDVVVRGDRTSRRTARPADAGHASGELPFHARFAVLRLSTVASGPPLLDRETALFDDTQGGLLVPADAPIPVELRGRGRQVTVRVGGRDLGALTTVDAHGSFAFVARGPADAPRVVVDRLQVLARPRGIALLPIGQAALLGLLTGLALARRRGRDALLRGVVAAAALLAGGAVGGSVVLGALAPESEPTYAGVLAAALCGLPCAVLVVAPRRSAVAVGLGGLLGVPLAIAALELAARIEAPRLPARDDARLSAVFGPESGSAPYDALAGRVRAPSATHLPESDAPTAVFLGGAQVFEEPVREPTRWAARLAAARLEPKLRAVVLPTVIANLRQQLLLFETFYFLRFRPRVLVVGVPAWEPAATEAPRVVATLEHAWEHGLSTPAPATGSALWSVWRRADDGGLPVTGLGEARAAIERACDLAEVFGSTVLLVVAPELPTPWKSQLGALVQERGGVVVAAPVGSDPEAAVDPLAEGLRAALRR